MHSRRSLRSFRSTRDSVTPTSSLDGGGDITTAPATPANAYVAEGGTTFYVAEDGTTYYVTEA